MNNAQLQFQFPEPGNWRKLILTAVFPNKNGFIQSRRFTQDDISQEQAETFNEVVTRIARFIRRMESASSLGATGTSHRQPTPGGRGGIPKIQGCGRFDRRSGQCPGRTQAFHQSGLFGVHDRGRGGSGVVQSLHDKQQRIIMNKITTVNGVLVAAQSDFAGHAEDKTIHLTEEERAAWNAKADASALSGKVDTGTFTAHETNTTVHVSQEEKEKWNARNTKGVVTATQDGLDEHTENTTVHITEEERTAWNEATAIPGASNAFTGDNTHAGTETFSGPVILNGVTTKLAEYGDSSIPTRLQMRAASQAAIYAWDGFADTRVIPGNCQ